MEAAARLFDAKGLAATSITEIVDEAGYTTGALYSNFANKEELFVAVIEQQVAGEMAALQEALTAEPTMEGRLRLVGDWYASKAGEGRRRIRAMAEITLLARHRGDTHTRLLENLQRLQDAVAAMLRQQQEELGIEFQLPLDTLAAAVLALVQGFVMHSAIDDDREVDSGPLTAALGVLLRPRPEPR